MTSSTGASGLTRSGSPPKRTMALRIAARSTTHGTPVKSCRMTRGGGGDLVRGCGGRIPLEQRLDIGAGYADPVLEAQQVLEEDLQRVGQTGEFLLREGGEAPDLVGAVARGECRARPETVRHAYLRREPLIISGSPLRRCPMVQAAAECSMTGVTFSITAPPRQRSES